MSKHLLILYIIFSLIGHSATAQAISVGGTSNFLRIPNNTKLQLQHFTLEAWIYITGVGTTTGTSSVGGGGLDQGTVIPLITKGRSEKDSIKMAVNYFFGYRASDRKLVADFEDNTSSMAHHPFLGNGVLPLNTWTHVAITYNTSGVWRSYINGKLDATLSLGKTFTPQSQSQIDIAIGSAYNFAGVAEGFFNGKVDEIRFWNVERTSSQIAAYYTMELSAATGLVSRYSLNEGSGTSAGNSVSGGSSGAFVNNPSWGSGYPSFVANTAPSAPSNPAPANSSTLTSTTANLCVTVSDPQSQPLTVSFYGRKKTSTKKFTMVLLPDPQYYVAEPQLTGYIKGACNAMFKSQTKWIANNRAARNIVYVGGLGDCSDHGDRYSVEWKRADTAIRTLEDPMLTGLPEGIPYGLPVGNHDQAPRGDAKGTTYYFNKYFGYSRYSGRSYYGGHYGSDNDNHYQFFTASGINFLVLCPEWDMSSSFTAAGGVLDWMEKLVKAYPKHKVIVLSHYLISLSASFTTQGRAIYERLKAYPNLILMAAGHIVNEDTGAGEARRSDTYNGRTVHTITQDYQARNNGGAGLLRTYEFDPQNNKVSVQTYSPYTNTYETDANSQFTLDVDLSVSSTFTLLGQQSGMASGTKTYFSWSNLETNATYEWYVKVSDGQKTTTGPVWTFTTQGSATSMSAVNNRLIGSLPEQNTESSMVIYPNPNKTKIISVDLQEVIPNGSIEFYSIAGQLQHKRQINNLGKHITFEHNLPNGMYKVVVRNGENSVVSTGNTLINR